MKTYTYKIMKGQAESELTVAALDREEAFERARAIEDGEQTRIEFIESREGTLEEFLGEESMARLTATKTRAKKQAETSAYSRKQTNTPAKGATRAKT